jgi:diketogulonate reductase-like aldo/keto reductase
MKRLPSISRRTFIAQTASLAAASSLAGCGSVAEEKMRTRTIPGTNESIPVSALGSPDVFYITPEGETDELPKTLIQTMYDMGGRLIDTPAWFRPDPPVVGPMIQEMNLEDELFLVGKITVDGREAATEHLNKTIANLGKRPLDLMLLHNLRDAENTWPVLEEAKAEGRVRYIGTSEASMTIGNDALEKFMRDKQPDFIMPANSISLDAAEDRILPLAEDMGIAVISIEAFKLGPDDGAYFSVTADKELPEWAAEFDCESWAQFGLKYTLSHPAVTCVATETSKPHHVVDNMGAGYGRLPDQAMRKQMQEYFRTLLV